MTHEPSISYRSPLTWSAQDGIALDRETILCLTLPAGILEIRHRGDAVEIREIAGAHSHTRLTIEPRVSNQIMVRIEPL